MKTPNKVKVQDFADWFKMSSRHIRQLAADGKLPPVINGSMAWPEACQMMADYFRRVPIELQTTRLEKMKAEKSLRELELAQRQDRVVDRLEARSKAMAVLTEYHSYVRAEIEFHAPMKRREKLQSLGVGENILAAFFPWDTKQEENRIDAIANRCQQAAQSPEAHAI